MHMQGSNITGDWITLVEYASRKGVSLSTLRRHIKANKLEFKFENGRYLLLDQENLNPNFTESVDDSEHDELKMKVSELERKLMLAREEVVELKMLLALYEEKIPSGMNS